MANEVDENWLSVEGSAARLGRSAPQVRRLARGGVLAGRRVAGVWLLDEAAVAARAGQVHSPGRPLSATTAWLLVGILAHELDPDQPVPVVDDRRKRYQLRKLIEHPPPIEKWHQWFRNRAKPRRIWVHDGVLDALADDSRLRPSGAYAAQQAGTDLSGGLARDFYVDEVDLSSVLADYRARNDPNGQVLLRVLARDVDAELAAVVLADGEPVPLAVVAVDLLESRVARERHLAIAELHKALAGAQASLANGSADG